MIRKYTFTDFYEATFTVEATSRQEAEDLATQYESFSEAQFTGTALEAIDGVPLDLSSPEN